MRVEVKKWGNSLALRIPKAFAQETRVKEGTRVDFSVEEGRLVVTPLREKKVTLKELLSRVRADNLHEEVDFGPPRGREAL